MEENLDIIGLTETKLKLQQDKVFTKNIKEVSKNQVVNQSEKAVENAKIIHASNTTTPDINFQKAKYKHFFLKLLNNNPDITKFEKKKTVAL
ncbi:hypothetical protein Glove_478g22 [Diversispora epigaea]|uniref:Uncharacterized protein n=1 Tax=Diversispora epigaea TaxID=1348612 RepID=A0A397GTR9_9GLOM|nr:hypothetical protein Glove_478g22 [Diversispora epigaea]